MGVRESELGEKQERRSGASSSRQQLKYGRLVVSVDEDGRDYSIPMSDRSDWSC